MTTRKTFLLAIATIALTLPSTIAQASEWFLAAESTNETKYFIDKDSLNTNGNIVKASVLMVKAQYTDDVVGYTSITEFDCSGKRMRDLQTTIHKSDGSNTRMTETEEWKQPRDGSVSGGLLREACNYRRI